MRKWLIAARQAAGLTVEELATKLDISESFYLKVERCERQENMDPALVAKLSAALGISYERILELEEERKEGLKQGRSGYQKTQDIMLTDEMLDAFFQNDRWDHIMHDPVYTEREQRFTAAMAALNGKITTEESMQLDEAIYMLLDASQRLAFLYGMNAERSIQNTIRDPHIMFTAKENNSRIADSWEK